MRLFILMMVAALGACRAASRPDEPPAPDAGVDALVDRGRAPSPGADAASALDRVNLPDRSGSMEVPGARDAAARVDLAPRPDAAPATAEKGTPVFVAVGYAGRRVRSLDLGKTWVNDQTLGGGGDDEYLLRGVAWAQGTFVTVGWKILTSPDGVTWTERKNPERQWLEGIQFGNGRFVAVGGVGYTAFSPDGIAWTRGGSVGAAARSLAFGAGRFMARTDQMYWWSSLDGVKWARETGGHVGRILFCGGAFVDEAACAGPLGRNHGRTAFGGGVYVSVSGTTIERSEDGVTWTRVRLGGASLQNVAFGRVH